jgi:fibronectin-binding autotransporter adhesin
MSKRGLCTAAGMLWACTSGIIPSARGDTWDNSAGVGSTNWSTPTNWLDNSEPANLAEPVVFPTPIPFGSTVTLSVGEVAQSLTFDANYTLTSGDLTLGIGGNVFANSAATINSALIGSNGLRKQGAGTLTLGGTNTFTGGVSITGGTLQIGSDARLGAAANNVSVDGGTLATTASLATSRTFSVGASGGALAPAAASTLTLNSALGSGGNDLTMSGGGTLALAAASLRTASTFITSGNLRMNNNTAVGSGNITVSNSGDLELAAAVAANQTLAFNDSATLRTLSGSSSYTGTISVGAAASVVLSSGTGSNTLTIGNAINDFTGGSGATASIVGDTTGAVVLPFANNYAGNWSVNTGTLRIGNASALGSGAAAVTVNTAALELSGVTLARGVTLNNSSTLRAIGTAASVGINTIASSASVAIATGASPADTLTIGDAANDLTGGPFATVTVSGSGTVLLPFSNNYQGNWVINGGKLRIQSGGSLGGAASAVAINSGAILELNGVALGRALTLGNGSTLRATGASASNGTMTLPSGAAVTLRPLGTGDVLTLGDSDNDLTGGGGASTITIAGFDTSAVVLAQRSNYVGKWVLTGGILENPSGDENRFGNINNPIELAGGTLRYSSGGINFLTRPLIANGGGVRVDSGTLGVFSTTSGSFGGFTKTGAGTLNLYGPQTHGTSAIYVDGGTLNLGSDPGNAASRGLRVQVIAGALTMSADTVHLYGIEVDDGQTATLDSSETGKMLVLDSLEIAGAGRLNLNENKLIIVDAGDPGSWDGTAYTGTAGYIQSGSNNGMWNGGGIVTGAADALTFTTTLGIALAQEALSLSPGETQLWGGETVSGSDVLVMYTYAGDLNLDGAINADDYARIDLYSQAGGETGYSHGDINYDGAINADDYALIDLNVTRQGNPFLVRPTTSLVAVPEPAVGAIAALLLPLMRRRRHRSVATGV